MCLLFKPGPGFPTSHAVVFLCSVSSVKIRSDCSFCWYWWNWWQSLFISFQKYRWCWSLNFLSYIIDKHLIYIQYVPIYSLYCKEIYNTKNILAHIGYNDFIIIINCCRPNILCVWIVLTIPQSQLLRFACLHRPSVTFAIWLPCHTFLL